MQSALSPSTFAGAHAPPASQRAGGCNCCCLTREDLTAALGTATPADETQARAAMIAAEAQQQMARTGAITALLTNRDNLGPALQQQLDTGMTGYMARLFGGGR